MYPQYRVFVDFDGTLVQPNVAILLVERFAENGSALAHEVDLQLHRGEISLRQAWDRQAALLPADRVDEMARWAVDSVPLRNGAREFLDLLREHGVPTAIVSGGLDFYIRGVLEREGIDLPFLSDTLEPRPGGGIRVAHPFGHPTCRLCGICKAQAIRSSLPAAQRTVFLGDGSTDRYGAEVADIVFARHRLKTYCEKVGLAFYPFDEFPEVTQRFRGWLEGIDQPTARPSLGLDTSPCPISQELARRPPTVVRARGPGAVPHPTPIHPPPFSSAAEGELH